MAKKKGKRKPKSSPDFVFGDDGDFDFMVKSLLPPDLSSMKGAMRNLLLEKLGLAFDEEDETPLEQAQRLMYAALEVEDREEAIAMAEDAIDLSPDCADAYVFLANQAESVEAAIDLYQQGVAAARRAIGEDRLREYEGVYWMTTETRPLMRAMHGLAIAYWSLEQANEAISLCREMLRLNPNDNQGNRYLLVGMYLDFDRNDDAAALLDDYDDDVTAEWLYSRALLAFRREGDAEQSRKLLAAAEEYNPYVATYLLGQTPIPTKMRPTYFLGEDDEAALYANRYLSAWKNTPGSISWLRRSTKHRPASTEEKRRKRPGWTDVRAELAELPIAHNEIWELDVRQEPIPNDPKKTFWLLVVAETATGQIVEIGSLEHRPKDADVWQGLVDAMKQPSYGSPRRPAEVRTPRKTWHKVWKPKLKQIGVDCQMQPVSPQVESVFAKAAKMPDRYAGDVSPAQLSSLPQEAGAVWIAGWRRLKAWTEVKGQFVRPWAMVVADPEIESMLWTDVRTSEPPKNWLEQSVLKTMAHPSGGDPRRPGMVKVDGDAAGLAAQLESIGVGLVVESEPMPAIGRVLDALAEQIDGSSGPPALTRSAELSLERIGEFYAAAAEYYLAQPWRKISADSILEISCNRFDCTWYAVVMGKSGTELGLALNNDADLMERMTSGLVSADEMRRESFGLSLCYGEEFDVSAFDVDEAARQGWPIGGPEAYPALLRIEPELKIETPSPKQLESLEICLRAIPEFVAGDRAPAQFEIALGGEKAYVCIAMLDQA